MLLDSAGLGSSGVTGDAIDLGDLVFHRDEHVNLDAGDAVYQFRAAHDAQLTIDATDTEGDCIISLYDSNQQLLERQATTAESSASSRVDYAATAGESFYVTISGNDSDLEVRIGNQVGRDSPVSVYGSTADDVVDVGGTTVTVNGIEYHFAVLTAIDEDPLRFMIDGAEGSDTVVLRSQENAEMHCRPDLVTWTTHSCEVEATDVAIVLAYGHGDHDIAHLHGSPERDELKIEGESNLLKLIGSEYLSRVKFFEDVIVDAGEGQDQTRIWDTETDEQFFFHPDESMFEFASLRGWKVRGYRFEDTVVRCLAGGTDWGALYDSDGDDLFLARPHKAEWSGPGFGLTLRGMDFVEAYSKNGGSDRAKLHGGEGNDQFETLGDQAGLSTWTEDFVPQYRIRGFEWVKAYTHGGKSIAALDPEADFETVLYGEWTEVTQDELAEHLLNEGGGFF